MREFKVGYGKPSRKKPALTPEEEIEVLQGMLNRLIQEEKYELAAIIKKWMASFTNPKGPELEYHPEQQDI